MSQQTPGKRYVLRALAILLFAFSCATFVLARNSFAIESLGLIALLGGLQLVRAARPASGFTPSKWTVPGTPKRPGRLAWILLAASLAAAGISYHFMYTDALGGYHETWPLYLFLVAGAAVLATSGYVVVNIRDELWKVAAPCSVTERGAFPSLRRKA
jgi:hypothetical protein